MQQETIQISAYTPPPNGAVTIDGAVVHTYESFQTPARYREYRDCGFTEILFAGEDKYTGEPYETSKLKKMLDMAADADLKAVVFDERLLSLTVKAKESIIGEFFNGNKKKFSAYVRDCLRVYAAHPAFYGISVLDEPQFSKRDVFAEMCAAVRAAYPKCFVMTCLLPCIQDQGLAENAFGTGVSDRWGAYRRYLAAFASSLGYVHYDCYPFGFWEGKNVVAHKFIRNMQEAALTAKTCGVPFHMTVQSFSSGEHDELRHLDGQDLSWQTDLALGFGASKIYYFTYWRFCTRNAANNTSAIMDDDGTKLLYDAAQANNKAVQDTARYVTGYVYESSDVIVGRHGNDATEELLVLPNAYLQNCRAQADILINTLKKDDATALMLLNLRDPYEKYANAAHIEFTQKREEIRIVKGGELLTVQTQNNALDILLEPGEAVWILGL